jgi:hypothetical protein
MTAKDDEMLSRFEAILEAKEAELEAAKDKKTVVGTVMKNGGGAATGAVLGSIAVAPAVVWGVGAVLAPFTGGLSLGAAAAISAAAVVGTAVVGHKMAKDVD